MIDWWVISSILAGLGTAYGANAYNKKDATELQKKAAELLASPEGKGWAAKIEELQSKVAATEADKQKAEEAAAKLQAAIDELKSGIQTKKTALTGELQSLTSPDEVAWATVDPGTFVSAIDLLMTGWLPSRGIQRTPTMDRFAMQIRTAPPQARGTLQGFYAALKEAYEKRTGGRRGRGRKRKGGVTGTPAENEAAKTALAEIAPVDKNPIDTAKSDAFFAEDAETPSTSPAVEVVPVPPVAAPEAPTAETPAVEVVPVPPVAAPEAPTAETPAVEVAPVAAPATEPPAAGTPAFPTQAEFSAEFLRLVSAARVAPPTMAPGMAPPMMVPGMPPAVPLTKKDTEAQKAALALAEKLTRAKDAAVKEIEPYKAHAETLAEDKKAAAATAYATLSEVFSTIGTFIPQLTQQEVREALWKEQKKVGEVLNGKLIGALKVYKDAVGPLPSKFLSMFKTAKKQEEATETVSTARHDEFVASIKETLDRAEKAPKAIQTLRKSIKSELEFFRPPEQFRGGCALVKRARDVDVALAQSNFELKEAAPALKELAAEFKTYTSEAKGSRIADSVFPLTLSNLRKPTPTELRKAAILESVRKQRATPLLPAPPPLPQVGIPAPPLLPLEALPPPPELGSRTPPEPTEEAKKASEVMSQAAKAVQGMQPPPPPPEAPPQDGGLFGFSSKPGPVISESPVLAGLYTSLMAKQAAVVPILTAYETAIQTGEGILKELQEMHSKEKAYLRLPREQWAEERKACGYLEPLPTRTPSAVPSASLEAPAEVVNPLAVSRGLKIKPKPVVNVLPAAPAAVAAPTDLPPPPGLVTNFSRLPAESKPDEGIELTSPAAPAAPAAPALAPLEMTTEPPRVDIVPMGQLPERLRQVEAAAPPGLIRQPSDLLRSTASIPTKESAWWGFVRSSSTAQKAVREMVQALVDSVKGLPKKEDRKEKLPALKAAQESLLQLSAPGSTQAGGATLEEDLATLIQEIEQSGGRSRKTTFKRRRGGKQNGRRSRRGKNRADRTHSHSR